MYNVGVVNVKREKGMTSLEKWNAAHPFKVYRDMLMRWTSLEKFMHYRPRPKDWREGYKGALLLPYTPNGPVKVSLHAWERIFTESTRTHGITLTNPKLCWPTYQKPRGW